MVTRSAGESDRENTNESMQDFGESGFYLQKRIMRRILPVIAILLVASGLMMTSCKKASAPDGISDAIYNLVQELNPTSVDEYLYNSEKVYHFDTWSGPDDFTELYSKDGELMAYFGGFTGKGDGRCTDFSEKATFIRTIYAKGRWVR